LGKIRHSLLLDENANCCGRGRKKCLETHWLRGGERFEWRWR
jgi:phosphoribosyl-dephospho-CoA transferase